MTDEYSSEQPGEPSLAVGSPAAAPEYGAAPRPPFGPQVPVPVPPVRTPLYRRTGVLFGVAAVAVAVVAGGVGLALSHTSSDTASQNPPSAPAQGQAPDAQAAGGQAPDAQSAGGQSPDGQSADGQAGDGQHGFRHRSHAVVGTIAAENGDTWTVNQVDGTTTTVTITPQTRFGTRANQETQSQFAVGNQVAIRGKDTDGVLTARWVGQPGDLQHPPGEGVMPPAGEQPPGGDLPAPPN